MATHGAARTATIRSLERREPFRRSGYGMWAHNDRAATTVGEMPADVRAEYMRDAATGEITYTVVSYATPIAWVLADGTVKIPDVSYSRTTGQHQHLCRVHL